MGRSLGPCQPALSSPRTMLRWRPAPVSRAKVASSSAKKGLERPLQRYQSASPLVGCNEGGNVQPLVPVVTEGNRSLTHWRPDSAADRLQAEAMLVLRPDLDRAVGMYRPGL